MQNLKQNGLDNSRADRVSNGIKLLNEAWASWYRHINCDELNLEDCSKCILGQIHGNYNRALKMLFGHLNPKERHKQAFELGFHIEISVDVIPAYEWAELTTEWVRRIHTMRANDRSYHRSEE